MARARAGRNRAVAHRRDEDARRQRRERAVGVPSGGHARRHALRRTPLREAMSYTLRGRLESRLTAALLPVLVAATLAAGLRDWWPLELAALMVGVGVALDVS